ncbi:MAG: outer membrane protein assembly factor BamD [Candidatus Melainabacteria bacterium]|nr:outer membrane protein assembly factor BamD [Candidatus Melainabacteria bacterium]
MKKFALPFLLGSVLSVVPMGLQAAYTYKNGKLMKSEEVATMSVQEHYSEAMSAFDKKNWDEVVRQSTIVIRNFGTTPFAQETYFYLAVAYFEMEEFEYANKFFTTYLKKQATPKHFEEAIQYKFKIAEKYQKGAKKHVLGLETLPKWVPAREEAIAIFDEVITALPHHELAAHALFGKAKLLLKDEEYKSSIETYQTLIRRFPKHPLAAEGYIGVGQVYLVECQAEYPDQDYLDLAEINLRKFKYDFPGEEKVGVAEKMLADMKEVYASDLYETGRFYERTKKPHASHIYYTRILAKYPDTKVSKVAERRLGKMKYKPEPAPVKNPKAPATLPAVDQPSLLNLPVQEGLLVDTEEKKSSETAENVPEAPHEDIK